jgi:hypothetical protein
MLPRTLAVLYNFCFLGFSSEMARNPESKNSKKKNNKN